MCASAVFHLPLSQHATVERGAWNTCTSTALAVLPDALYFTLLSHARTTVLRWSHAVERQEAYISTCIIIYSTPTVPRPRHIFTSSSFSFSKKSNDTIRNLRRTVRISHFTSCLQSAHTTHIPELLTHILFDFSRVGAYPLRAYCDRTCTRRLGTKKAGQT